MNKKFYEAKALPGDYLPSFRRYDLVASEARPVYVWAYSEKQARYILEHDYPNCEILEIRESTYRRS